MLVPTAPLGLEGWRWVVLIGAFAAPVVVFLRRGLPESPRWLAKHGRLAEADRVLSAIEAKVEAEYGRPLPPPGFEGLVSPASGFLDLWLPGIRGRVVLMSVFNIFQTVGYYGFDNWVPSLLVKQGITVSTSLGYTAVIALAAPIGPLLGFFLGDRLERKWIIVGAAAPFWSAASFSGNARFGAHHRHGRRTRRLAPTSCRSASTPTSKSCSQPASAPEPPASSIVEPAFGHLQLLHHRLHPRKVRRSRRLRLHRGGDGGGDGDDRPVRTAHDQSGFGENLRLSVAPT